MKKIFLFISFLFCAYLLSAQDSSLYQRKIFIRNGDTLRYRILYPENAKKGKVYPLLVFLHGSGERGNDNGLQLFHGGDLFLKPELRTQFPAVVIFPQCPLGETWSKFPHPRDTSAAFNKLLNLDELTTPEKLVKLLMDSLSENKRIDKKRIYLGGLSLGGFGTYDLAIHYPRYFAAVFPICGQANVDLYVRKASHIPVWIFHGAKDNVVNPQPDRDLIKALQDAGAKNAKYTEYPEANHNSWDSAFAEPGLLPWLFSQKK
ncbi:MAG: dienelactone hydrolase family protein [Bacteroidota bacterium]|nr:dienelactone hydrolase family protein [Bacteroidota bacterium]MDP4212002.1 dienelactone hydrolase family protein [Bacteroidota bacterium]MDP4249938.1 dienelactone hydrolase family protein [Bacteroidota bacterium]